MLIRLGYDIRFQVPASVAMVALLNVHPSRVQDLLEPDELQTEPRLPITHYIDSFGNRCAPVRRAARAPSFDQFHAHSKLGRPR